MWPQDYWLWIQRIGPTPHTGCKILRQLTTNEVMKYPILAASWAELEGPIFEACERALDLADEHRRHEKLFPNESLFHRWLRRRAFLEVRRFILHPQAVRGCFRTLSKAEQETMLWYYCDILPEHAMAWIHHNNQHPARIAEMQKSIETARLRLVQEIQQHPEWDAGGQWTFPL